MGVYGLYDCELWHRGKTMPNLELMKVYNYHYSRGEIVRLLRPQDKTDTYTKVIYFKDTSSELPRTLEVFGENKQIYGWGFYNKFYPLDEKYKDTPPSYLIYEPYEEKFKIAYARFFKKASFVRLENNDFSGYNKNHNYIFVADHAALSQEGIKDFLQNYKTHSIYFNRGIKANTEEELALIYPYRDIVKNRIVVDFFVTPDIIKKYKDKIYFNIDSLYDNYIYENYLIRVILISIYFNKQGRADFLSTVNFSALPFEIQQILKWASNSTSSFKDYYMIYPNIQTWIEKQSGEIRSLLKTKPSNFTEKDLDMLWR